MTNLKKTILDLSDSELWTIYALTITELKNRKLIRTRNITGEYGEQLAIKIYNTTPKEPRLQVVRAGHQDFDAVSKKGDRYSIKTITSPGRLTGVIYGLNPPGIHKRENKKFEYLIIVIMNDMYQPIKLLECSWDIFLKYKRWHKTMRAWNITVTQEFERKCRQVYPL